MCSFSAPRRLAEVLATLLGSGKVSGPFRRVVGRRRLLATSGLGVWLEMGVSVWRSLRHIGSAINVGGRMYVPYPTL